MGVSAIDYPRYVQSYSDLLCMWEMWWSRCSVVCRCLLIELAEKNTGTQFDDGDWLAFWSELPESKQQAIKKASEILRKTMVTQ